MPTVDPEFVEEIQTESIALRNPKVDGTEKCKMMR